MTTEDLSTKAQQQAAAAPSRRTVLCTAGLAGAGVMALGACGAAQDAANSAASSASDAATGALKDAVSKATIPEGGGKVFPDQKVVVTQPTAGEFKAFTAVCTHQGCVVSDVANGTINCGCHGSKFDITTGAVKAGPAKEPLPEKKVTVGTDGITVS
ncbi:Rieske (2Fe-2S) protein [Knoellia koreensis]|jgi:Rieske Fe-S protein|uniref:Cytochrome bc1 complex Rieske iron-sulfur subunit n=1 Tax=Knoellia koreensis TaxID=2730921 RepID=A0A849H4Y1_9MICO|nr:Rieske (2Fe-2S) protein [Knoellia sp. DB2414S]NNM44830.1 Rieske (2Fe-2S) protein [Knoellia sp. DB2414S]